MLEGIGLGDNSERGHLRCSSQVNISITELSGARGFSVEKTNIRESRFLEDEGGI